MTLPTPIELDCFVKNNQSSKFILVHKDHKDVAQGFLIPSNFVYVF